MLVNIFYFVLGILMPYAAEQYSYARSVPQKNKQKAESAETSSQGYGWRLVWDASFFLMFVGAGYRIISPGAPLSAWEWTGYFCFLLGVTLRIWALRELGQFYDPGIVIKTDHRMIHTGPYRILRHPLHLGTLLQITGLAGFSPIWLGLPAVFASLLLCLYLNRTEDRTHSQQLGSAFEAYYLKTWDIIDLIFWKSRSE